MKRGLKIWKTNKQNSSNKEIKQKNPIHHTWYHLGKIVKFHLLFTLNWDSAVWEGGYFLLRCFQDVLENSTIPLSFIRTISEHVNTQAKVKALVNNARKWQECKTFTIFRNLLLAFYLSSLTVLAHYALQQCSISHQSIEKASGLNKVSQTLTDKKHHIQHIVHPAQHTGRTDKETHSWWLEENIGECMEIRKLILPTAIPIC